MRWRIVPRYQLIFICCRNTAVFNGRRAQAGQFLRRVNSDAMVGEDGVRASSHGQARHVAAEAILVGLGMGVQKRRAVALQAAVAIIGDWLLRELMRIMASAAP